MSWYKVACCNIWYFYEYKWSEGLLAATKPNHLIINGNPQFLQRCRESVWLEEGAVNWLCRQQRNWGESLRLKSSALPVQRTGCSRSWKRWSENTFQIRRLLAVIRLGEIEQCSNDQSPKLNKQGEQQHHFYLSSNFNLKWEIDASSLISSVSYPPGLLFPYVTRRLLQAFNMKNWKQFFQWEIFSIWVFTYDANKVLKVICYLQ